MKSPSIAVWEHGLICILSFHEDPRDYKLWTAGIDVCAFVHQIARRPSIVQDDGGVSAEPNGDDGTVEFGGPFFESIPWFTFRQLENVSDDREREWSRRHFGPETQHSCIVCRNCNDT
jgi:hypothetical protein